MRERSAGRRALRTVGQAYEFDRLLGAAHALPTPRDAPDGPWRELDGSGVLLSAPHEVQHIRDGERKCAEPGTGPLAFAVARVHGAAAICTAESQTGDPSWDVSSAYVRRVAQLAEGAEVVLDLHMMLPRGVHLGIGLGPYPAMVKQHAALLVSQAEAAGLKTALNWPYRAERVALTSQLQHAGIPTVQLEIAASCFEQQRWEMPALWTALSRAVAILMNET